ncbi:MAG: hypothetical protein GX594_03470 [Pirellulaceae bacterium]|nr:hypothetical protein [Pirellulaceae bacterium]
MKRITSITAVAFSAFICLTSCTVNADEKISSDTKALPSRVFNALDYGAVSDDKTDNTKAFSACIEAVIEAGGGTLYLPAGVYRGRIVVPPVPKSVPSWITVEIVGEIEPAPVFGTIGAFPPWDKGTILRCLEKSGPAVISVDSTPGAFYSSFSAVNLVIKKLDVRTYDDPAIGGIDLRNAAQCKLEDVFVNTDVYCVQASKPTHTTSGLITPACNNAAMTILRNVVVTGYHTGILVNEHTDADNIVVANNNNGLEFLFAHHASRFARVGAYGNRNNITIKGRHAFSIEQLNIERPPSLKANDINDPENLGIADINYWVVIGGVGATEDFTRNGGASIRARRIGSPPAEGK